MRLFAGVIFRMRLLANLRRAITFGTEFCDCRVRVLHAVAKIERLRRADEALDALLDVLAWTLNSERAPDESLRPNPISPSELVDAIASRVIERMTEHPAQIGSALANGQVMFEAST